MDTNTIPQLCKPCIHRLQQHCPHLHTIMKGGWHLSNGEVWDDLTEVCMDCGADLDELALQRILSGDSPKGKEETP